jgi:hypothetical protein
MFAKRPPVPEIQPMHRHRAGLFAELKALVVEGVYPAETVSPFEVELTPTCWRSN